MWEWSNGLLNKKKHFESKSLLSAYNDLLPPELSSFPRTIKDIDIATPNTNEQASLSPTEMQSLLEKRLKSHKLANFELRECPYEPQTWQEMNKYFDEFYHIRGLFLKLIGYSNANDCLNFGLNQDDIKLLQNSQAPENYNVHIKIPFDFGGSLDFSNLCFVRTHPTHDFIHRLIDMQIENNFLRTHKKIFLPYMEGKFYYD